MFQTLLHPIDFDEPSKEAFRVTRSLAQIVKAPPPKLSAAEPEATGQPGRPGIASA